MPKPGETNQFKRSRYFGRPLRAFDILIFQPESDIFFDRQMRKQRVMLKHQIHRPLVGRKVRHVDAINDNVARIGRFKPGYHPQQSGFAAAARSEQRKEFPASNINRNAIDGCQFAKHPGNIYDANTKLIFHRACAHPLQNELWGRITRCKRNARYKWPAQFYHWTPRTIPRHL